MIPVAEAQARILSRVSIREVEQVPLQEAIGRILAEPIRSPLDLPSFDNSAMDGYAVQMTGGPVTLRVIATARTGDGPGPPLKEGSAIRILTGAMVPEGADAVIRQEAVAFRDGVIEISRPVLSGENIRFKGEEIRAGDPLLEPGERLGPAAIGLLASCGINLIPVASRPRVGILVTGSEIVTDPRDLSPGKVFDSNSFALSAALKEIHLVPSFIRRCPDEERLLARLVQEGLESADFLVVTGGVSVGDFDFVRKVSEELGVEEIFWRVKQKPGRPIFLGKRGEKFLFGLPGNPVSTLVCFYEYLRLSLLKSMGAREPFLPVTKGILKKSCSKKEGLTHFVRGRFFGKKGNSVMLLEKQGSHMMTSFAGANCLVVLPEEREGFERGDEVEVHLLPA
ncbi:MAG: molybdopterin molybdotransferase MoeA [Deltaproteobacteria bacterium]|nr:molybdopterin molybdotransferase MoeA [Deltaproteobacteria bacterium]